MSTVVELVGYTCFVVAGWLVTPALGLLVAGVALILIAHALEGAPVQLPKVEKLADVSRRFRQRAAELLTPKEPQHERAH